MPRTTQPPYSHVDTSAHAELDWLELTALRACIYFSCFGLQLAMNARALGQAALSNACRGATPLYHSLEGYG